MDIFRKKAVSYVVLVATAFCMLFTSPDAAQAATVSSVTREITLESRSAGSADKSSWYVDYIGYNSVTKDTNTTYNNSPYSIKVVNNTYSVTEVKKTYKDILQGFRNGEMLRIGGGSFGYEQEHRCFHRTKFFIQQFGTFDIRKMEEDIIYFLYR